MNFPDLKLVKTPDLKLLATFDSEVIAMQSFKNKLYVATKSDGVYYINIGLSWKEIFLEILRKLRLIK